MLKRLILNGRRTRFDYEDTTEVLTDSITNLTFGKAEYQSLINQKDNKPVLDAMKAKILLKDKNKDSYDDDKHLWYFDDILMRPRNV